MKITKLKGGSLSSTCLYQDDCKSFVRKSVSTKENREYGFVRWYTQLKKLQRYQTLVPGLVPQIIDVGYDGDTAYFDLEYLSNFKDIKTIFSTENLSTIQIEKINDRLWSAFNTLHARTYQANPGAGSLYFKEEVLQKITDANTCDEFKEFYDLDYYTYHGKEVPSIRSVLPYIEEFFKELSLPYEEFTHGNPTLENTMYSDEDDRIVFIDLYEESIVDSKFLDYSQVLQCSRSMYGVINDQNVIVDGSSVGHNIVIPQAFKIFNSMFEERIDQKDKKIVDVLEATQFIRMLPFKCFAGHVDKAKFFYVHACYLLDKIFK